MSNIIVNRSNFSQNKLFEFLTGFFAPARAMVRATAPLTLKFEGETDSSWIYKGGFTMVMIGPLPAALDGLDLDILAAAVEPGESEAGAIPKYKNSSGSYVVFETIESVATGDPIVLQAETAALPWIALRASQAKTCEVPVTLTA